MLKSFFSLKTIAIVVGLAYLIAHGYNLYKKPPIRAKNQIPGARIQSPVVSKRILATANNEATTYAFSNIDLAYQVLTELDVFQPTDPKYHAWRKNGSEYETPFLGLKNDDEYCNKHRRHFVKSPNSLFSMNFLLEATHKHIIRTRVCPEIGTDMHPKVSKLMPLIEKNNRTYNISPAVNHYWTSNALHVYKRVGKHYSCLTQSSNHILGVSTLNRKDYVAQAVIDYAQDFADRPQCFSYHKFFPKTWLLNNATQCTEFFEIFNSPEYYERKSKERIVYIRKEGAGEHRGLGVQPVNDVEEEEIRRTWSNGAGCGTVKKNYLVQNYVQNPLLLNGRKFDFRMYLLVASTDPLIGFYHDGFLRVTISEYDVNSDDKSILLTNLALNDPIYKQIKNGTLYNGMNEEALKRAQQWNFERLDEYLRSTGVISDPNWLDNYLRPELKKGMIHLMRLATKNFYATASTYEIFGVDFLLDTNLDLWFLEANSTPAFDGYSEPMEDFIVRMLQDHVKVINGLLKSRMKRIINYVNNLIRIGAAQKDSQGNLVLQGIEHRREEFAKVIKNSFEPEYLPGPENGFSLIYDGNYEGVERYQGYVTADCV